MKGPHVNEGGGGHLFFTLSWTSPDLGFAFSPNSDLGPLKPPSSQNLRNLFKVNKLLTCDCKTGFLAQDGAVFVLSEALIKPFVRFVSSPALDLGDVKGAVGEQVDAVVLCHLRPVLEPPDVDGRLSLGVTVQNNGLSPHHDDITGLLDEK